MTDERQAGQTTELKNFFHQKIWCKKTSLVLKLRMSSCAWKFPEWVEATVLDGLEFLSKYIGARGGLRVSQCNSYRDAKNTTNCKEYIHTHVQTESIESCHQINRPDTPSFSNMPICCKSRLFRKKTTNPRFLILSYLGRRSYSSLRNTVRRFQK